MFIIDSDAAVGQAVGALAVEVLPPEAETVIAKSTSVAGAKRLLERVQAEAGALVIVICATEFGDGSSGLEVLSHARAKHPGARVVLMTGGERDAFVTAIASQVDGFVSKASPLAALRSILQFLGSDPAGAERALAGAGSRFPVGERAELQLALRAMASALEAVERAQDAMARADDAHSRAAREALREAEILAVTAHRRMLEAERGARPSQS